MCAEATLTLADGRRVRFQRQKKNANGFNATVDGKLPLSETDWAGMTSGLDLKAYQSLFGFSLDELRSGEKALVQTPIEDALSSSGFGGLARLQKVQNRINDFLSNSLKRVGVSGAINAKLAEIETAERHLESVLTLPADVTELRTRINQAQADADRLQAELLKLRQEAAACQRQQAALPRASEYRQIQQSLAQYNLPEQLDHEFRVQWSVLTNRLAGARSELANEVAKLQKLEQELASLPPAEGNSAHQADVVELGKQARDVPLWRQQLERDQRDLAELENEVSDSLRKLGWSRNDARWRTLQLDLNQQAEITGVAQSLDDLNKSLNDCRTRIDAAEKQLHMHRTPAATETPLPTGLPTGLGVDRMVEIETQLRALRPLVHQFEHLSRQLNQSENDRRRQSTYAELIELTRELSGDPALQPALDWPVPQLSQVTLDQQQVSSAHQEVTRLDAELLRTHNKREELERELSGLKSKTGIKSLAELEAIWCQRDQVVSQWREELRSPLLASSVTPTEHEERLTQLHRYHEQSDNAVRAMLADMTRSAELISREREVLQLQQQDQALRRQLDLARAKAAAMEDAWHKLWQGCPLCSQWNDSQSRPTIERTLKWLELFNKWQPQQSTLETLKQDVERARLGRDEAWQALLAMWPEARDCKSPAEAEQLIARSRSAMASAEARETLLKDLEKSHKGQVSQRAQLEQRLAGQQQLFQRTRENLGLPESWAATEFAAKFERLKQCQALAARMDKLRERLVTTEKQLGGFTARVSELAARLGLGSVTGLPEEAANLWAEQFTHSEQADHRRLELGRLIAVQKSAKDKRQEQLQQLEKSLEQMVQLVGAQSIEQVQSWNEQAGTVFQLRAKETELSAALRSYAAGEPLEKFLTELAETHPRTIAASAATLSARLAGAEAAAAAAQQQIGGMTRELEFKEQGSAALLAEQQLKRLRAELVELSEQWVVHKLAGELLEQTINRFTRDHEPQLIKHTRRFFKELTDGRYSVVEHDSGKHGGFAVRDNHGNPWQPDKLSTGRANNFTWPFGSPLSRISMRRTSRYRSLWTTAL